MVGLDQDLGERLVAQKFTRRGLMRVTALAGGAFALSGLIAACGGDDDDTTPTSAPETTATTSGSTGGATPTAGSSTGAATSTTSTAPTPTGSVLPPSPSAGAGTTPTASGEAMAADQTFRIWNTEPQKIDPNLAASSNENLIDMACFDPLLSFDRDGNAYPLLAEKWDISEDGITMTFNVRSGAKWSDGKPVTAGDFEYSFKRLCDPALASEYAQAAYPIVGAQDFNTGKTTDPSTIGVTASDDQTLVLTLTGPAAYFPRVLATWNFLPVPKWAVDANAEKWVEPGNIVTCGVFLLDSWNHDQDLTLVKNPDYWGEPTKLDKIVMTITTDPQTTSVPAFENDELDVSAQITAADIDRIRADSAESKLVVPFPHSGTTLIFFDTSNTDSPSSKKEVRQALYLALDLPKLTKDGLKDLFAPATVVTPPGIPGRNEAAALTGGADKARELLSTAGYPDGKGFPTMTLTWPQAATYDSAAQIMQQMWKDELGIDITLTRNDPKAHRAFFGSLSDKTVHYDFYIWGWGSDYEDPYNWFNILWESDQDFFRTRWVNADYDKLVKDAAVEQDPDKRFDLYKQSEVILMDEMPVLPMYYDQYTYLVKPYVKDLLWKRVANERFLQNVWIADH